MMVEPEFSRRLRGEATDYGSRARRWGALLLALCVPAAFDLSGNQASFLFLGVAAALLMATRERSIVLSPVIFVAVAYVFAYPLPFLFPEQYVDLWDRVRGDALEFGIIWSLRGFCAFALGYVLFARGVRSRVRQFEGREGLEPYAARYASFVVMCIGCIALLSWVLSAALFGVSLTFIEGSEVDSDSGAGSLVQALHVLGGMRHAFFVGFAVLYLRNRIGTTLKVLFLLMAGIAIIEIIIVGSKATIIRGAVVVLLALMLTSHKFSMKQGFAWTLALGAVVMSFGIIGEYRTIMRQEHEAGRDVFDFSVQFQAFGEAAQSSLSASGDRSSQPTVADKEVILGRLGSGLFSFSNLLEFTGRQPPFENAVESFLVPIYSLVPRALMPGRAEFFSSGTNAETYYGWNYGGISVSTLGSFYYAWGYPGIICGMALLGAALAFVIRKAKEASAVVPEWWVLLTMLLLQVMDVGTTFQAQASNFIRVGVVLLAIRIAYSLSGRALRRESSRLSGTVRHRGDA